MSARVRHRFLLDVDAPSEIYARCRHGYATPDDSERCDVCGGWIES